MEELFNQVKLYLRIKTEAFDDEIKKLINAGLIDLETSGISTDELDDLLNTAICIFVKMNFGEPANFDKLKLSYDELKAKMNLTGEWKDGVQPRC